LAETTIGKRLNVEVRKLEKMNRLGLQYIYSWKNHKETPCVATFISNKQKCQFFSFLLFFFYKIREKERNSSSQKELGISGSGEVAGKRSRRANIMQIL
jgi:CRISPR/Cas system endoribonuclease Cas6 (RAMP superfamily)